MPYASGRSRVPVYRSGALSSMEVGSPGGDGFTGKMAVPVPNRALVRAKARDCSLTRLAARRHGNPGAVVATHQHAILGLAEVRNAHGKPNPDRRQCYREREGRNVRQHAMPEVVRLVTGPLIVGQIVRCLPDIC